MWSADKGWAKLQNQSSLCVCERERQSHRVWWPTFSVRPSGEPHGQSWSSEAPRVLSSHLFLPVLTPARLFKCTNITTRMQAAESGFRPEGTRLPGAKAGPGNVWSSLPSLRSLQVSPLPDGRPALPEHTRPASRGWLGCLVVWWLLICCYCLFDWLVLRILVSLLPVISLELSFGERVKLLLCAIFAGNRTIFLMMFMLLCQGIKKRLFYHLLIGL